MHASHAPASSLHSNVAPLRVEVNWKDAFLDATVPVGPLGDRRVQRDAAAWDPSPVNAARMVFTEVPFAERAASQSSSAESVLGPHPALAADCRLADAVEHERHPAAGRLGLRHDVLNRAQGDLAAAERRRAHHQRVLRRKRLRARRAAGRAPVRRHDAADPPAQEVPAIAHDRLRGRVGRAGRIREAHRVVAARDQVLAVVADLGALLRVRERRVRQVGVRERVARDLVPVGCERIDLRPGHVEAAGTDPRAVHEERGPHAAAREQVLDLVLRGVAVVEREGDDGLRIHRPGPRGRRLVDGAESILRAHGERVRPVREARVGLRRSARRPILGVQLALERGTRLARRELERSRSRRRGPARAAHDRGVGRRGVDRPSPRGRRLHRRCRPSPWRAPRTCASPSPRPE